MLDAGSGLGSRDGGMIETQNTKGKIAFCWCSACGMSKKKLNSIVTVGQMTMF
jgi:hypothetical protein